MNIASIPIPLILAAIIIPAGASVGGYFGIVLRLLSLEAPGRVPVGQSSGFRPFIFILTGRLKPIGDRALSRFVVLVRVSYPVFLLLLPVIVIAAKSSG